MCQSKQNETKANRSTEYELVHKSLVYFLLGLVVVASIGSTIEF